MALVLAILATHLLVGSALAGCALTAADWQTIQNGLGTPNFYQYFKDDGDCNATGSGLLAKYGDCSTTFETVLANQGLTSNCRTTLSQAFYLGNGALDESKAINEAISLCSRGLGDIILTYLCDPTYVPGCPKYTNIAKFAAVVKCLGNTTMSLAQRQEFFASGTDKECMTTAGFCDAFSPYQTCLSSLADIIDYVYTSNIWECDQFFYGYSNLDGRCSGSLQSFYYYYCPQRSIFEQNLVAFAVGIPAGVFGLLLFCVCCYKIRSGYISDREVIAGIHESPLLKQRDSDTANLQSQIHPELAAVMEKKSKYKGITYDMSAMKWRSNATGLLYTTELEAAQAAYYAQASLSAPPKQKGSFVSALKAQPSSPKLTAQNSFSGSPSPIAAYIEPEIEYKVESDEEKKQRRIYQLINFYEYWDADKPDIAGHADNLLRRHDFTTVARAVKTKYGLLPAGWDEELAVYDNV